LPESSSTIITFLCQSMSLAWSVPNKVHKLLAERTSRPYILRLLPECAEVCRNMSQSAAITLKVALNNRQSCRQPC